ncbi:MAG: hypothetical protein ACI4BC_08245, partial [Muribaculaceae bacterium]
MKKIYLFLALAIAVAINANATLYLNTWENGKSELHNACKNSGNWTFSADGTYTFSTPLTITQPEQFLINEDGTYYKTSTIVPNSQWTPNKGDEGNNMILAPGTYTKVTFDGTTLKFEGENIVEYGYKLHVWENGANVLYNLPNTYLKKIADNKYELVFDTPITLSKSEYFGIRSAANDWMGGYQDGELKEWIWVGGSTNNALQLAPGTYYSVTLTETGTSYGNVVKFNTYAETATGLNALYSAAADYVGIKTDIYVSHHWGGYYSICTTTEGSQAKQPILDEGKEQDIVKWGDNPDKFVQLDWFRIADTDNSLVEKQFQAGTIVSVADKKVVKFGAEATPVTFTPSLNIYRPISFAASEEDKEKFFLVTPQDGEKALVRGRYTKVDGNDYLTDNNGRKVAFLNNTLVTFVDDDNQWYEVECYINKDAETGIYDLVVFGAQVATGVESVETANATVFAANG